MSTCGTKRIAAQLPIIIAKHTNGDRLIPNCTKSILPWCQDGKEKERKMLTTPALTLNVT
jgi:hypothetical protein